MNSKYPDAQIIQQGNAASIADYEKAIDELQAIVERLERGEQSLEASLKDYERGVALEKQCQQALDQAEQRIRAIEQDSAARPNADGNPSSDSDPSDPLAF